MSENPLSTGPQRKLFDRSVEREPVDLGDIPLDALANRTLHQGEEGEQAKVVFFERTAKHAELLQEQLNFENPPIGVEVSKFRQKGEVFDLNSEGLTDDELIDLGFPPAPRSTDPLCVAIRSDESGSEVYLLAAGGNGLDRFQLFDHAAKTDSTALEADWSPPARWASGKKTFTPKFKQSKDRPEAVIIDFAEEVQNGEIEIIRKVTQTEKVAMNEKSYRRRTKWSQRIGATALAVSGLLAGVGATNPEVDSRSDSAQEVQSYQDSLSLDQAALERFEAVREMAVSDSEQLRAVVENSEFAGGLIGEEVFESLGNAMTIEEIQTITNRELEQFSFEMSVPDQNTTKFVALDSDNIEAARAASEAVLHFSSIYGSLTPDSIRVEVVDGVYSNHDNDEGTDDYADGHYSYASNNDGTVVIRLSAGRIHERNPEGATERLEEVYGHEIGHALDDSGVTLRRSIASFRPEEAHYEEARYAGSERLLRVGEEVATEYGRTNPAEDLSETLELILAGNFDLESVDTVLENKIAFLIADIEEEHPGFAASVFMNYVDSKESPSRVDGVLESAEGVLRSASNEKVVLALLSGAFLAATVNADAKRRESQKVRR